MCDLDIDIDTTYSIQYTVHDDTTKTFHIQFLVRFATTVFSPKNYSSV